jgi:CelD/BcsL family acetyltransferase involved in cellulose biosynthesis
VHGTIESLFRVEWRALADLASVADDWRALAARALEPNVFYEPAFALAAAPVFGADAGAGLVWSRTSPPRLVGLFPARVERRYGLAPSVLVGWTHPYAPLGVPLVDAETADSAIAAWLDHLATQSSLPKLMLLPMLTDDGALARALERVLTRRGGASAAFARHERAMLAPSPEMDHAGYLEHALGRRKRKELGRQMRRLGDSGVVTWSIVGEPSPMHDAIEDFLRLEASGWKGRAGTAARDHADIHTFMQGAVVALAGEGKAHMVRLLVDSRAIAALILLQSRDTAWSWKIAYDESAARASPGVQLILRATTELLEDPTVARADSCAAAHHPMIDHVWRERLPLSDRLIRIGTGGGAVFALARMLEGLRQRALVAARRTRDLLKR